MPLFYQHNINRDTKLAIWHIEEPDSFFLEKVPFNQEVAHPLKRLQHLAGRYLLAFLFADFPLAEILIADTRKPFLEKEQYHFSISHCGHFAAAIVSKTHRVGVDVELVTPRIESVRHKFLSQSEFNLAPGESKPSEILTQIWSAKEAIFKWHGSGKLDFKKHIQLKRILPAQDAWNLLCFGFQKGQPLELEVATRFFEDLVLAWLAT
jgi:phosphopantetheinyl transferase